MEKENIKKANIEHFYYEEDEIDLYELWLTLKKRWKVVFFSTLLFVIASIIYLIMAKPVYESKVVFKLPYKIIGESKIINLISSKESIEYTKYLENLLKEKKYETLAKLLSISTAEAKNISSIDVSSDRRDKSLLFVSIDVYSPEILTKISNGLLNYLNHNKYLLKKLKIEKELLKSQIKNISSKLGELENLRNILLNEIKKGEVKDLGFNPTEIDTSIINLKNRLKELKSTLENLKGFEISVPPFEPDKPAKPKKGLILAVSIVSGLFLGIFLAFFVEWVENVKKRRQEEAQL